MSVLTRTLATAIIAVAAVVAMSSTADAALPRPALPLSASGLHIVDSSGTPFQMRCGNWPGHMETMLPEGIQWASLDDIVALLVQSNVYNCIRLTYSADMWSIVDISTTARQSLTALNLTAHITAISKYNPDLIDARLVDVQAAVVKACNKANVLVLFDNQVSKPSWCCSYTDGNGWWNDEYFGVDNWLTSLNNIASHYADPSLGLPNAVAFSLRNELRNDVKNRSEQVDDWYKYVAMGIDTLHNASSSILIFVSGVNYDTDFSYLNDAHPPNRFDQQVVDFASTLVFEAHDYSWSGSFNYSDCPSVWAQFDTNIGWPYQNNHPLVLTEVGLATANFPNNAGDAEYWNCIVGYVRKRSLGFGVWLFGGSYLWRNGMNTPDAFGNLNAQFTGYQSSAAFQASLLTMIVSSEENGEGVYDDAVFAPF